MEEDLVVIDIDAFKNISQEEFVENGFSFEDTFDTPEEFSNFMVSVGMAYPEGVPWDYIVQKINSYRFEKITNSLKEKGLIKETWIGDEPGYSITELGREIVENLGQP